MEFALSKIDAAVEQLDWAIRLFLDHQAYLPAITLAGAAEEILGQAVGDPAAFAQLKTAFSSRLGVSEKIIGQQYLNKARNWLKHWDLRTEQEDGRLELDEETIQYIVRALTNLAIYDGSQPSEGPRFWSWMDQNRRDLLT